MKQIIVARLTEEEIPFEGIIPSSIDKISKDVSDIISKMISADDIDGTKITKLLFGVKPVDIFISYSHKDEACAKKLAAFLSQYNVSVFLDCLVWNSSDAFLKQIDKDYAYDEKTESYSYEIRNRTTAHAHAILSTALMKQVASSRYMIVLNPNSLMINKNENIRKTGSPWIYEEIIFAKTLIEHNACLPILEHMEVRDAEPVPISYQLPIENCDEICGSDLDYVNDYFTDGCLPDSVDKLIEVLV